MRNHIALMFIYAALTALFFALLWREEKRDRIRMFAIIFVSLFVGGTVAGWVMYPFPLK